jgi:uncharacterized protein YwgA
MWRILEASELILILLSSKSGGIDGRTAVQKLGYFVTVFLKKNLGYEADFYGPYSTIIAANLQNLVESDFVTEREYVTSRYRKMYSYDLNDEARLIATNIKKKYPKEAKVIENVVRKCDRIANCDYNVLSWAAKVHFILEKTNKAMTYPEAIAAGSKLGWKLSEQQIASGAKLLKELRLIQTD